MSYQSTKIGIALAMADWMAVFSTITDLILACFPIIILRRLQISARTKIALCLLMGLGVMYVNLYPLLKQNSFTDFDEPSVLQPVARSELQFRQP